MNESQKHSRLEMEILAHEKEMMHAARIRQLNEGPLIEKINFVKESDEKKQWTSETILEELKKQGLDPEGNITKEQVEQEMNKKE